MVSPFDVAHGISFKTLSTAGPKCYLNSTPGGALYDISISVYMTDVLDYNRTRGCFWTIIHVKDFTIRLETKSESSDKRFLNSSGGAPKEKSVYLSDNSAGLGSHWTTELLDDGSFSILSHSPSEQGFLTASPTAIKKESVFLSKTTEDIGTHWNTLVTSYAGDKIERIIHAVYPSLPINSCEIDAIHASLDYDRLHAIWNDSQLGEDKNSADYPVHLKTEVSKRPNTYNLPDVKGSLCGIMWGTIEDKSFAINFTIDPFVKLILFDPQNGQQIPTDKFTPTFCMV